MRASILLTLAGSALAFSAPVWAGPVSVTSTATAAAAGPDFEAAVTAPGRGEADVALDESRKPAEVLDFMGLETGDVVLDIFAGGGYYSEILGRAVGPQGSVSRSIRRNLFPANSPGKNGPRLSTDSPM